jgi:hypothetical protein
MVFLALFFVALFFVSPFDTPPTDPLLERALLFPLQQKKKNSPRLYQFIYKISYHIKGQMNYLSMFASQKWPM